MLWEQPIRGCRQLFGYIYRVEGWHKVCYIYDVTKQIKEAPNPYEVEIVLDKLPVPTKIGGNSGFTPGVSDWNIIEIPIVM